MRFINAYLGPDAEDAYQAMFLLNSHTKNEWYVEEDDAIAQVLGHCSIPLEDLLTEMTPEEIVADLWELLSERWPGAVVWISTEEDY